VSANTTHAKSAISFRSVALPAEHGGWGFLVEPLLLGLILAPSLAGIGIAVATSAVFLLHQPIKIVVKDYRKGRVYERTRLARGFAALYGAIALAALQLTVTMADGVFWLPLLVSLPFAAVQLALEFRNDGRSLLSETCGALVLAATASAILLAANETFLWAAMAWLLMTLRAIPSILYVRTQIRLIHSRTTSTIPPLGAHLLGVLISIALWAGGLTNGLVPLATSVLLCRAFYGLQISKPTAARIVGIQEVIYGIIFTIVCAIALQ
jgi:hypothetical protein